MARYCLTGSRIAPTYRGLRPRVLLLRVRSQANPNATLSIAFQANLPAPLLSHDRVLLLRVRSQANPNTALSTAFQADQHLSTDWLDMPTPRRGTAFQGGLSEGMCVGEWCEGE